MDEADVYFYATDGPGGINIEDRGDVLSWFAEYGARDMSRKQVVDLVKYLVDWLGKDKNDG